MEEKSKDKEKDHSASKLQRVLSAHSLEGLIYEKRERKQVVNTFAQPAQNKKQKNKRLAPTKNKKQVVLEKKKQKSKEKYVARKKKESESSSEVEKDEISLQEKIGKPKKRGRPKKQANIKESDKDSPEKHEQKVQQPQEKDIAKNSKKQQQKEEEAQKQQQESEQNSEDSFSYEDKPTKKKISKQVEVKSKHNIKNKNGHNKNRLNRSRLSKKQEKKLGSQQDKENENRIEAEAVENKINGVNEVEEVSLNVVVQNRAEELENNQIQSGQNKQSKQQNQIQQQQQQKQERPQQNKGMVSQQNGVGNEDEDEEQQSSGNKKRKLRNRRNIANNFNAQTNNNNNNHNSNEQEDEEKQSVYEGKKRRLRKTKDEAMKKFVFQGYSDNEDPDFLQTKRRRGGTGGQKQYQINRIFRKSNKINLPNAKIDVNIMNFCLQQFAQKFKEFDMIHCSLPIDMLVKLPNISSLIKKGFIFIWAEKGEIQIGYHWLNRIGFDVIDQIMWIKTNETVNEVKYDQNTEDEIFPNCRSTCLVGYKCSSSQKTEYCTKISNNIIFSPKKPVSIEKPQEIYEIGDLMMPGARKLEIGFKEVGGWFTLKHKENSFIRCHECLRRDYRILYLTEDKSVKCQHCIIHHLKKTQDSSPKDINDEIYFYQKLIDLPDTYKLQIITRRFVQSLGIGCTKCGQSAPQLLQAIKQTKGSKGDEQQEDNNENQVQEKQQRIIACKNCFQIPPNTSYIKVHNLKQVYFPKKYIKCSKCEKSELLKYYFECSICKNGHILCSQCFLAIPQTKEQQNSGKTHEWKLKILNEFPQTRVICFSCAQQCKIPYWGCEKCQNWYWCGCCDSKQKPKSHEYHCHYFSEHNLHLIM